MLFLGCRSEPETRFRLEEDGLEIPTLRLEPEEGLSPTLRRVARDRRMLVDLAVQVDLHALGRALRARGASKSERRRLVVAALERVAAKTQAELAPLVAELERRGEVRAHRSFRVVNRLLVEGTSEAARVLAADPRVAAVVEETETEAPILARAGTGESVPETRSWALDAIGAERAWRRGIDGTGVVIGLLDSGASAAHEQLAAGFRGGPRSWLDPAAGSAEPRDGAYGHGTGVLSCALGRGAAGGRGGADGGSSGSGESESGESESGGSGARPGLGVAPGARWVACAALPEGRYNNVLLTVCADWMLRVARPDVVVNAWLLPRDGCDPSARRILDAWRAAEILPVFTAGNHAGTDRSPANYGGLYPGDAATLSVGGLAPAGELYARSGAGPSRCDGGLYPTLVAPAVELTVALPLGVGTYLRADGTSYAAGFVAGAAALLLDRHPEASVVEIEEALRRGAADLGPPGPDPRFGHGRLDVPAALDALDALRGSAGTR